MTFFFCSALLALGADAAENEQHFAEILPIGRRVAANEGVTLEKKAASVPLRPPRRPRPAGRPAGCTAGSGEDS